MYDDFAVLDAEKIDIVNDEYKKYGASNTLSVDTQTNEKENIVQKVEYLQELIKKMKANTKNRDTLLVLGNLAKDVEEQKRQIERLLDNVEVSGANEQPQTIIFCNNLKLAMQTTNEITKMLIQKKDDNQTAGETKPQYTQIILSFLDINNQLSSLFGECRYRVFGKRKLF